MRRIISSVFVIVAVLSVGIFATGAYFTDTITQDNYTFQTQTADLKFAFCGSVGTDCTGTAADLDNIYFDQSQITGPGKSASDCVVIENKGQYTLALSTQLFVTYASHPDMAAYFEVAADRANANCNPISALRPWATAAAEASAGQVGLGVTLAPGDRLYVITYNRWNSTGNQDYLQGGTLKLKTVLEGRTS